jgi:hypothetical protein
MPGALSTISPRKGLRHRVLRLVICLVMLGSAYVTSTGPANADPNDPAFPPLPDVVVGASSWAPKFPIPYDHTRNSVTEADVNAEREMCQWFNQSFKPLRRQIDAFGFNLLAANNDWQVGQIQAQADSVANNIDHAVAFLAPRAQALTQTQDFANDNYFPLYQGESFYRLWQHLSNVGVGIKARNTAWVNGPSEQRVMHWGSRIERSHVCD